MKRLIPVLVWLLLVNIGMPPMEAIKAATSVAAACIGVDKSAGSIKAGLEADLIVVERNPLTDMRDSGCDHSHKQRQDRREPPEFVNTITFCSPG